MRKCRCQCHRTFHADYRAGLPLLVALSGVWGVLLGCGGDTTGPAFLPATQLYVALTLNKHAINLALTAPAGQSVVDTVHLSATALTAVGTPLASGDSVVRYSDPDSSVTISPTGLVTAHYVTSSTQVIASLTVGGVTRRDTAVIRVTQAPFPTPLATLSIQPLPLDLDSAAVAIDASYVINNIQGNIPVYATDTQGDSVCSNDLPCQLVVHFASSDPTIATIDENGFVTPVFPGRVKFIASALAYGVAKVDTLDYVIGYPVESNVTQYYPSNVVGERRTQPFFEPRSLYVGVGATLVLYSFLQDSVDVVFDDSTAVVGGGTRTITKPSMQARYLFNQPGSYTFRSRRHGGSGQVVVIANRDVLK